MTIYEVLSELAKKIKVAVGTDKVKIEIGSIGHLADGDKMFADPVAIILSVVNIGEERLWKKQHVYEQKEGSDAFYNRPTGQVLAVSVLFTSYAREWAGYGDGLNMLEHVMAYLREHTVYCYDDTSLKELGETTADESKAWRRLIVEMTDLNPEQMHHVWSYMGGKYMPCVLYRFRLLAGQQNA